MRIPSKLEFVQEENHEQTFKNDKEDATLIEAKKQLEGQINSPELNQNKEEGFQTYITSGPTSPTSSNYISKSKAHLLSRNPTEVSVGVSISDYILKNRRYNRNQKPGISMLK